MTTPTITPADRERAEAWLKSASEDDVTEDGERRAIICPRRAHAASLAAEFAAVREGALREAAKRLRDGIECQLNADDLHPQDDGEFIAGVTGAANRIEALITKGDG